MTGMRGVRAIRIPRDKVFGDGRCVPLDGNAKARIWAYAKAYTAKRRQKGQHRGPLTRATLDVLRALLWGFHNSLTGRCFPAYERIADQARVHRATAARAIAALEGAGVLSWENRLVRQRAEVMGLFGPQPVLVPRRTSNAYWFHDYKQDAFGRPLHRPAAQVQAPIAAPLLSGSGAAAAAIVPLSTPKSQKPIQTPSPSTHKHAHEATERRVTAAPAAISPLEQALQRLQAALTGQGAIQGCQA